MLERALKLRVRIDSFIREYATVGEHHLPTADILSKDDWQTLQIVHELMFPFWLLTLRLEGNAPTGSHGTVWEVLPAMEVLINRLEKASTIYTHRKSKFINACINNALMKLQHYYRLLDDSLIYTASLVLNPAIKERHFNKKWVGSQENWTLKTKEDIQAFWIAEYKDRVVDEAKATSTKSSKDKEKDSAFNMFNDYLYNQLAALDAIDEYNVYCVAPPLPKEPPNLIQY
jgi:hypothetical protein